jgi:hypothetical protein
MNLARRMANQIDSLGFGKELLDLYYSIPSQSSPVDFEVDPQIRDYEIPPEERKGTVLFPLITSGAFRYCLLAHAFRSRGYEPLVTLCQRDIPHCQRRHPVDDNLTCTNCQYSHNDYFEKFGIEPTPITELQPTNYEVPSLPTDDPNENVIHRGIPVSEFAKSSTRVTLKKYHLDFDDQNVLDLYFRNIQTAIVLTDITHEILDTHDIDAVIAHHGGYIVGGVPLQVATQYDVPAASQEPRYIDGTLSVGFQRNRSVHPQFTNQEYVKQELKHPLSTEQREQINTLMKRRAAADSEDTVNNLGATSPGTVSINTDKFESVTAMFTNIVWDASLTVDRDLFEDCFEWVDRTIELYRNYKDHLLIVKIHPAENILRGGTNESMTEWIDDHHRPLPENIIVLDPGTDVDTYALFEQLDTCLVYNSTVGLEAAYRGLPVVVAGETYYRNLGFTYEPETKNEYDELLITEEPIELDVTMQELAQRFAYLLFVRSHIEFPFFETSTDISRSYRSISHDDLKPGNENIDLIVEKILNHEPVVYPRDKAAATAPNPTS